MAIANGDGPRVDFVQFNSRPKKGKVPRYLLEAQVRKRFLEQPVYNWRRQVKGAALTGNPEHFIEIYRLRSPRTYSSAMTDLGMDDDTKRPAFQKGLQGLLVNPDAALKKTQRYTQMDYLEHIVASDLAMKPYLLHTTITLNFAEDLTEFSALKFRLLPIFAQHGLSLIVAGQLIDGDPSKPTILNVWSFEDVEEVESLMMRLSDNLDYFVLNMLGTQEQHIYRNVSRHYQFYPLWRQPHPNPSSGAAG